MKRVFSSFVCQDEDDIQSFSYKRNRALVHLQLNTSCVCDSSGQFSRDPEPDVSVYDVHEGVDPLKREATMEVKGNRLHVTRYVWILMTHKTDFLSVKRFELKLVCVF